MLGHLRSQGIQVQSKLNCETSLPLQETIVNIPNEDNVIAPGGSSRLTAASDTVCTNEDMDF